MRDRQGIKQRIRFLLFYTILFAVSGMAVFRYFPAEGRRMVWKGDGLSQHYVALCYYARWGKAVLKSLLAGQPAFPTFNMHMGYGADLFTTLQPAGSVCAAAAYAPFPRRHDHSENVSGGNLF